MVGQAATSAIKVTGILPAKSSSEPQETTTQKAGANPVKELPKLNEKQPLIQLQSIGGLLVGGTCLFFSFNKQRKISRPNR